MIKIIPDELPSWLDSYKLLIGSIVPRPIAFVSTVSPDGVYNLAAFSFFNGVCPRPFIISFAPMFRPSNMEKKDTLRNIEATGQFVVNIVTEDIVAEMNQTSPEFPPDVDEFEVAKLTPIPSTKVIAPRVAESPIHMECELVQVLSFGDAPGAGNLVLGRVVAMHFSEAVYQNGKIDIEKLRPVARLAGDWYSRTNDRFVLNRPR